MLLPTATVPTWALIRMLLEAHPSKADIALGLEGNIMIQYVFVSVCFYPNHFLPYIKIEWTQSLNLLT